MISARLKEFCRQIFHRERLEEDLDDEVRAYFDLLVERAMAKGLTRDEAKRAVRIDFDGPEQVKERVRRARMTSTFCAVSTRWRLASIS